MSQQRTHIIVETTEVTIVRPVQNPSVIVCPCCGVHINICDSGKEETTTGSLVKSQQAQTESLVIEQTIIE